MRKLVFVSAVMCLLGSQPAQALFTNGGFEDGTFNGWTLAGSGASLSAVINSTATMAGQSLDVDPYNGTYMARLQNSYGAYHRTTLSQSDTISQADIDAGATLYVNWGAMLVEPTNNVTHYPGQQPEFGVTVTVGGTPTSYTADATAHSSDPAWVLAGTGYYPDSGDLWYKSGTWSFDLSAYAVGTVVSIALWVEDCALGGHGGYAFLDGIGTTYQPPDVVPEPGTLLLLGSGLLGLAGARRRQKE